MTVCSRAKLPTVLTAHQAIGHHYIARMPQLQNPTNRTNRKGKEQVFRSMGQVRHNAVFGTDRQMLVHNLSFGASVCAHVQRCRHSLGVIRLQGAWRSAIKYCLLWSSRHWRALSSSMTHSQYVWSVYGSNIAWFAHASEYSICELSTRYMGVSRCKTWLSEALCDYIWTFVWLHRFYHCHRLVAYT